ncbi:unnamed protein product [Brassica oleracea]|nr:unnamed protein product [Brassica napus]
MDQKLIFVRTLRNHFAPVYIQNRIIYVLSTHDSYRFVLNYTPKNVMMELECGKEEYVRSNVAISKDNKILLPKLVELYAKDTELRHAGINDMIVNHMPCDARNKIQPCVNKKHGRFTIDWVPHDFRFMLCYV